jgi:hypothetical protein
MDMMEAEGGENEDVLFPFLILLTKPHHQRPVVVVVVGCWLLVAGSWLQVVVLLSFIIIIINKSNALVILLFLRLGVVSWTCIFYFFDPSTATTSNLCVCGLCAVF